MSAECSPHATPSLSAARWDRHYAGASSPLFGDAPNRYLTALLDRPDLTPRTALMLADGDGRNGAFAARRGIDVTAVDLSPVATRLARERDRQAGVRVERHIGDLTTWQPPKAVRFDLAAIVFLQGPRDLRRRAVETATAALAPGGWLVLEGFAKLAAPGPGLGPDDPAHRYDLEELPDWIAGLEPMEALEGLVRLDEGARHRGLAAVIRLAARRPA